MPFVHITLQSPIAAVAKRELMAFTAGQICRNTSTRPKNVYVYIHEESEENMLKAAPTAVIIWTEMPDRTDGAKNTPPSMGSGAFIADMAFTSGNPKMRSTSS